ncbi:hypothetical protein [Deinococcus multiflagellatus]|uniref:Collagen-like protein n=1 Tax=Deinococcus multiflagellatus TaxID=1656887 RepID=A0ABW1ZR81_9DEIO|nr:hypothetical protein [Deinococcus multiflagellatus]MBZ9715266.1 hypothetical protein [Deinococcus multiflagellatus]
MTLPTNPPPDPAQWNFTDFFNRGTPGPDYTVVLVEGAPPLVYTDQGQLVLGPMPSTNGKTGQDPVDSIQAALNPARWSGGGLQLQYDLTVGVTPAVPVAYGVDCGFELTGDGAAVRWDGTLLTCTVGATTRTAQLPPLQENTLQRVRLTIDPVAGVLQLTRNQMGLSLPLPAGYVAGMVNAQLTLFLANGQGALDNKQISARFDNLAIRNGDGTADLSTGQTSSGGVRLGGEWRFVAGVPDNGVGSDGDVWADTSGTGNIYQKQAGAYVNVLQLLAKPGEDGEDGKDGVDGTDGRDGVDGRDGILYGAVPVTFTLADATPEEGVLFPVTDEPGGLAGIRLEGVTGIPADVAFQPDGALDFLPVTFPMVLPPGILRLHRSDDSGAATLLRALVPAVGGSLEGGGSPGPYTTETDADGYLTITNASGTTDAQGYLTLPDGTATPDPDGYPVVERSN